MASLRLSMMLRVASNSIARQGEALKDSRGECGSRLADETAAQGTTAREGITGAAGSQQANAAASPHCPARHQSAYKASLRRPIAPCGNKDSDARSSKPAINTREAK